MPHSPEDKKRILTRVRRIRGQVEALERALESGEPCLAILQQIAAVRGASNGLMSEMVEIHLKDELVSGETTPGILSVVIAQPTAEEEYRGANIGVDVVKKDVQVLYHFGPPALTSTYCGAASWLKRR